MKFASNKNEAEMVIKGASQNVKDKIVPRLRKSPVHCNKSNAYKRIWALWESTGMIISFADLSPIIIIKKGQTRPIFVYFRSFHTTNIAQILLDCVLGTQTRGGRMVGANESTELWRNP